jgi:Protein of unknown function (DUF3096)
MFGLSTRILAIIAIIAGVLILILPGLLIWIVAIFLIVWGILAMVGRK